MKFILKSRRRLVLPMATLPGVALAGVTVRDIVTSPHAQVAAIAALHARAPKPLAMTAMDLSVEAEAFGCPVRIEEREAPAVRGRRVLDWSTAKSLPIPAVGEGRTQVYLRTVAQLKKLPGRPWVLGGLVGPFSLAAQLCGLREGLELTLSDPDLLHLLLDKTTRFLVDYATAFREAGADGLVIAEPTAGLMSPQAMRQFSSIYLRRITALADADFTFMLHDCAARPVHLNVLFESGAAMYHFGAPMNLTAALGKATPDTVVWGNLDPASTFCDATPEAVTAQTLALLEETRAYRNFVLSSGCEVPPNARLGNLDAFCHAADSWHRPARTRIEPGPSFATA